MQKKCNKCGFRLNIPNFTTVQKQEILKAKDSSLIAIKMISDYSNLNLVDSKALFLHINKKHGHCIRCDNTGLVGENVDCPKCKAFNLNWEF